jgi:hypothetical protein
MAGRVLRWNSKWNDTLFLDAQHGYLIIAGPYDDSGDFKLYRRSGTVAARPEAVKGLDFKNLHPEALTRYLGDKTLVQMISDGGAMPADGRACKDMHPARKSFRSVWVAL